MQDFGDKELVRGVFLNFSRRVFALGLFLLISLSACSSSESGLEPESLNSEESTNSETEEPTNNGDEGSSDSSQSESTPEVVVTENQFRSALRNMVFTYEPVIGADVYSIAPFASGESVDGAGIGLQVVVLEDNHFLQLRVIKSPTGDFDIESLSVSDGVKTKEFRFTESELFDAYIYEELTYEIGEMTMSAEDEEFWQGVIASEESEWTLQGEIDEVSGELSRIDKSALATPIRVKQGLDAGYEIPEGLAKPLIQ